MPYWLDILSEYEYLYDNENAADHFGKYSENFEDEEGQGWTNSGQCNDHHEDGYYEVYFVIVTTLTTTIIYTLKHHHSTFSMEHVALLTFSARCNYWSYSHTLYVEISIDGGAWEQIAYFPEPSSSWDDYSLDLSSFACPAASIKFNSVITIVMGAICL